VLDGELGLADRNRNIAARVMGPKEMEAWHGQLIFIAQERGYKPGWTYYKYKEKFGKSPPRGSPPEPIPPTSEVGSWVRSRQIAFAKSQQRASA
jgi:DNA repair protein RadD